MVYVDLCVYIIVRLLPEKSLSLLLAQYAFICGVHIELVFSASRNWLSALWCQHIHSLSNQYVT